MANNGPPLLYHLPNILRMKNGAALPPLMNPRPQVNKKKQISQVPVVAVAMPNPRRDRPVRSAKQVQPAPGYVDSSNLLFDSEDEGTESEGEHDDEDQGNSDDEDRHIAKKPRLRGNFKAQAEVTPPPLDSSCLAYYPETYEGIQLWNKMLDLSPPNPMSEAPTNKMPEPGVNVPESYVAKTLLSQDNIIKNETYDATKAGFENLPGEIRNKIYALVFQKRALIDFMDRSGFAHSAAFLRVNKLVYNEARAFLYGENRFCFGYNFAKSGEYFEPVWKELGWTHIRRFLTDIGPKNTSLIQYLGISFYDASQSGNPNANMDERRFTYNKDVLWILDHLSQHGKITKLKLGFCGRRSVRMSPRDGDFLKALKGVKTDKLVIGDPRREIPTLYNDMYHSKADGLVRDLLKRVMVRPRPLKDLDPRLKF